MTSDVREDLFRDQIKEISDQSKVPVHEAFPRWICQNILGITDEAKIDEAVSIGGKNDFDIDIFHADDAGDITEQYICWFQVKFGEDLDRLITRENLESFASTLGHLKDCPDTANQTFKQKSSEFLKMTARYPHIRQRMIFAVTGRLNAQANELFNNPKWRSERIEDPNVSLEILDLDEILSRMTITHTPPLTIRFSSDVIQQVDETTNKKSVIGYVKAEDLVRISKEHRESLFLEPRETLGRAAPTHRAITNTLSDQNTRRKFWKLNNGITATCASLDVTDDPSTYRMENLKIVDGRQTLFTLEGSTMPIDDVSLSMTVHETVDDEERSQISNTTNTQNPTKPADLIANHPEMTELVLQCRRRFRDFYFERQSKGFNSTTKSIRNRVTSRRVLEKSSAARAYYAYEFDPNDAVLPEKILFSTSGTTNYYDRIFKDRKIEELIVPHIFIQLLDSLHSKYCMELQKNPDDADLSRRKGIISKDIVKYYVLKFIYESMISIDDSRRQSIKNELIETFRGLGEHDVIPARLLDVAESAYNAFMTSFDVGKANTWPPDLLEGIENDRYKNDVPTPYEITVMLKHNGDTILPHLLLTRRHIIAEIQDQIKLNLLKLAPEN